MACSNSILRSDDISRLVNLFEEELDRRSSGTSIDRRNAMDPVGIDTITFKGWPTVKEQACQPRGSQGDSPSGKRQKPIQTLSTLILAQFV
jgi:hypothetical protein